MASTTYKIQGVLVTDPQKATWQAIRSAYPDSLGGPQYTKMRDCLLEFAPVITTSQFSTWFANCDTDVSVNSGTHTFYLPRRLDAAFTTDPEGGSFPSVDDTKVLVVGRYTLHFLGYRASTRDYVYDLRLLLYMWADITFPAPP